MGDFDIPAATGMPALTDNIISPKTRIPGNDNAAHSGLRENHVSLR